MKHTLRLALLAASLTAAGAHAQMYVEGAYTPTTVKDSTASIKPALITGTFGYGFHPNLALEGSFGLGIKNATTPDTDTYKYNGSFGVFLKPRYQVNESFEVFGRIGFNTISRKLSDASSSDNSTASSAAWGLGASYAIDKNIYLTGSYNQLHKKDSVKIDGFSLGVGYKF